MFRGRADVDEAAFLLFVDSVLKTQAIEVGSHRTVVSHTCVSVDRVAADNVACAYVEMVLGGEKVVAILCVGLEELDDDAQCIRG